MSSLCLPMNTQEKISQPLGVVVAGMLQNNRERSLRQLLKVLRTSADCCEALFRLERVGHVMSIERKPDGLTLATYNALSGTQIKGSQTKSVLAPSTATHQFPVIWGSAHSLISTVRFPPPAGATPKKPQPLFKSVVGLMSRKLYPVTSPRRGATQLTLR